MAAGVIGGDLHALQARLLSWQGARETTTATFGNERDEVFSVPLEGATDPDGQVDGKVSVIKAIVKCDFGVAYSDIPRMIVDLSLQDGEVWDDNYHPYITACVVSWLRLPAHEIYVGARVAIAVYDHPIGFPDEPVKFMTRLAFNGPASTTPIPGEQEAVDTTDGPTWDLPEE